MAQPATDLVQTPDTGATKRGGRRARSRATETLAAIPLDLGPLLAPYKKRGRLAIRVEQMPPLARLSAGRNNGDNSWSLGSDELEDLSFQPPETFNQPHTLAIRIMVHDSAGVATAAVLDYEISPDGSVVAPAANARPDPEAAARLRRLEAELAEMADQLDQRETALAAAREDAEAARMALELAREDWEKTEDKRLAEARADWQKQADAAQSRAQKTAERGRAADEREQSRLKDELASLRQDLAARKAELSKTRAEQTKIESAAARAQREALRKAEDDWKTAEAKRLAEAKAAWQKQADAALGQALAKADRGRAADESEQRRLKDELAGLRTDLAAREAELTALRAAQTKAQSNSDTAQRDALRKAEENWKAEEATRLADAKAAWQTEMDAALAEARAAADQNHAADEGERRRLTDELARLHKSVSTRDAEMTRLRATMINAEADAARAQREALRKAEEQWTSDEAARLETAEADWRAQMETALAEARADGAKTGSDAQDKITRLYEDLAAMGKRLAEREAELEELRAHRGDDADQGEEQRAALTAAEEHWKEQSAGELAALQARCDRAEAELEERAVRAATDAAELKRLQDEWRAAQDSLAERDAELEQLRAATEQAAAPAPSMQAVGAIEAALEDATARYEAAEAALADLRRRTSPQSAADMALLRDEIETLQTMLAQRETELARLRVAADRWHDYQEQEAVAEARRTTKRKPRKYVEDDEPAPRRKGGLLRDVALVAAVAVAGVLFTPKIVAALPYEWQAELPAFLQPAADDGGDATAAPATPAPAAPSSAPAPAHPLATILHGVNLRESPSSQSKVVETLKRGTTVEELGQQGSWHHVRAVATAGGAAVSGWVYKSYLKADEKPAKAAPKD